MKKYHVFSRPLLYTSLLISTLAAGSYVYAAGENNSSDNLRFSGRLVAQPCIIAEGDESRELNFDSIIEKSLYIHERTYSRPFSLVLSECDLSVGKNVKISFDGPRSLALPDLLAITEGGGTSGIAVGLETADGSPLALGKKTSDYQLKAGRNEIFFKAYIQAEPEAITKKDIVLGPFTAVATFYLEYE